MLRLLRSMAASALLIAAAVIAIPIEVALAQDVSTAGNMIVLSVAELVLGALTTIAVPAALAIWALIKARAAATEAAWDDWIVARVEKVVREVIRDGAARLPSDAPLDMRGRIGGDS